MQTRQRRTSGWITRAALLAAAALLTTAACTQLLDLEGFEYREPGAGGTGGIGGAGGAGGLGGCSDPSECPPGADTTCATRTCENRTCGVDYAAARTACTEDGGAYCDGQGNCVECTESTDCAQWYECNADGACVPGPCANGTLDGDETDVDCGGGTCPACPNGDECDDPSDCTSRFCTVIGAG
ncbi:MAG: hypothetical protein JRI23_09400, partial [Deltaproteobacteria bacterium]|nr:hypothetical protein [Deltaproteobacteria bacterium]MBW2531864.1 hypothetical protein [Deltaproteobacteria bacterium]